MPTRKLVVRYEQDLGLFPDRWQKLGLVAFVFLAGVFPFVASDYWLGISIDALVAVVGSVAMMILTVSTTSSSPNTTSLGVTTTAPPWSAKLACEKARLQHAQ